MDNRAAKLALARKKLKDHQEKKFFIKDDINSNSELCVQENNIITPNREANVKDVEYISSSNSFTVSRQVEPLNPGITHTSQQLPEENIVSEPVSDIKITEILVSNKRDLELQVHDLQTKLSQLEHNHMLVINDLKICNQKVSHLQNELQDVNEKYSKALQEIQSKETIINKINSMKLSISDENSNLLERLEFTKSILSTKEAENDSLKGQLHNLQSQYDVLQVQLQQLTNGLPTYSPTEKPVDNEKTEMMGQKIVHLEQQLTLLHKERDQMNIHYEHYVAELNEQLKLAIKKNEELNKEVQELSNREYSLIEQISDMEKRIQNYNIDKKRFEMDQNTSNIKALQDELKQVQENLNALQIKYNHIVSQLVASEENVKKLSIEKESECNHDNISKLSADMTSDKVAAQRATEQNKKLKQDLQGLEDAFVKMSNDKLELTEKLTAEKFLNRELTIKLAEIEENAKDMQTTLKAKDEEMIRLQCNIREIEKQCEQLKGIDTNIPFMQEETSLVPQENSENNNVEGLESCDETEDKCLMTEIYDKNCHGLQKEDAMSKLQERFLKIMGEVADLSDEKHRLEHIIVQLQTETDTICEYVALYQQQRSLLKRRDEERCGQLKVFQQECGKLKSEIEELSGILARFSADQELLSYFQVESKRIDMEKVMILLENLKSNSLIDPRKQNVEFKNFYPCNCCSGKLIVV